MILSRETIIKWLSWVPALLVMAMIFSFSSQNGETSGGMSGELARAVAGAIQGALRLDLEPGQQAAFFENCHFLVRKGAHFTIYMALGMCVAFPMYVGGRRGKGLFFSAWMFCIVYACFDEFHQLFVRGRAGQVRDVVIDSAGALWGVALFCFVLCILAGRRGKGNFH